MRGRYAKEHPCLVAARQLLSTFDGLSGAAPTSGAHDVNGQEVLLPTSINAELSLTRSQQGMVVQWMEKVEAHLNATGVLEVTANGSYAAQLCGACGNFNGDSMDDLMARGGRPASNTQEVLASWVAEDFSSSW
ncbi:unnamed protein product [Caretta caretta]